MHTYPLPDSEPETQTGVSASETSEASRGTESSITQAPTLQPLARQPPVPGSLSLPLPSSWAVGDCCPQDVLHLSKSVWFPCVPAILPPFTWVLHRCLGPTQVTLHQPPAAPR